MPINIHWFRRDLRLDDNAALYFALRTGIPVQCIFIFDAEILDKLENKSDRRVSFIHSQLENLNLRLKEFNSTLMVFYGKPLDVWKNLIIDFNINSVFTNHDYEIYARKRDGEISRLLESNNISFSTFKDQVIFERIEICKDDNTPYTVFTPYMKKWRKTVVERNFNPYPCKKMFSNFSKTSFTPVMSLKQIGFNSTTGLFPPFDINIPLLNNYENTRDIPGINGTSRLGVHLRFGTISIREVFRKAWKESEKWINELIWREFYMMILWNFPHVTEKAFNRKFELLPWRHDEGEFEKWCEGKTGYPIVDAGMRELNSTGFMHNRVRMITSMFLTKYLLIDWRWGESYFATRLLDYELSSNNGGWQWSAGTGVDAAPYFRIFNMDTQVKRFDPDLNYILKWIPELENENYPEPMVDYKFARERCLEFFKKNLIYESQEPRTKNHDY